MTNRYIYITLLAVLGFHAEVVAEEAQPNGAPRLVVSITIDQLRSDYLEAFTPLYSNNGFLRLLKDGKVYTNVSYPFTPIDRASATAAITTGVTPYYNNISGLHWLNRETLRPIGCVDDPKHTGINTAETASPDKMITSTIGDELKVATGGKAVVYAIAPFRESAVLSAGHAANGALWIDDVQGNWCSSRYYYTALPTWAQAFNRIVSPVQKADATEWTPFSLLGLILPEYEQSLTLTFTRSAGVSLSYAFPLGVMMNSSLLILALILPQVRAMSLFSRSLSPASTTSFLASVSL